jgi:hypothetical protein
MFTCVPTHRSAEPDSLAIRLDFDQRDELIAADPATYSAITRVLTIEEA